MRPLAHNTHTARERERENFAFNMAFHPCGLIRIECKLYFILCWHIISNRTVIIIIIIIMAQKRSALAIVGQPFPLSPFLTIHHFKLQ